MYPNTNEKHDHIFISKALKSVCLLHGRILTKIFLLEIYQSNYEVIPNFGKLIPIFGQKLARTIFLVIVLLKIKEH